MKINNKLINLEILVGRDRRRATKPILLVRSSYLTLSSIMRAFEHIQHIWNLFLACVEGLGMLLT